MVPNSFDIVVLPSYREGTPKILLEAAACGLPIVATDIPGCRGVVEHGQSGCLVAPGSVEPLANGLDELVGSPGLRRQYGQRGRAIIEAGFTHTQVIDNTLAIYAGLSTV